MSRCVCVYIYIHTWVHGCLEDEMGASTFLEKVWGVSRENFVDLDSYLGGK